MGRFVEALETRQLFTVYWVDTLSDSINDRDGFADGFLSLREAVIAASTNTAWGDAPAGEAFARDVIRFDPWIFGGTIFLNHGQLTIADRVTIDGWGLGAINGQAGGIFDVLADEVEIYDITLRGSADAAIYVSGANAYISGVDFINNRTMNSTVGGGAIFLDGLVNPAASLTVTDSYFSGNRAAVDGGAIVIDGPATLTVQYSTFLNNAATSPTSNGGAIANRGGTVEIFASNFRGNTAGRGGAISVDGGSVSVNRSRIMGNLATFGGGADVLAGSLSINASYVNFNIAHADGGGIFNGGSLSLTGTHVNRNTATGRGGAVFNEGALVSLSQSRARFNKAAVSGGGIHSTGGMVTATISDISDNRAPRGGGLAIDGGIVALDRSYLRRNKALASKGSQFIDPGLGGGAYLAGGATLTLTGSVVVNNRANEGGGAWLASGATLNADTSRFRANRATTFVGGGIFSEGLITLTNSWVARNFAKTLGGGIYTEIGGETHLANVIIRRNSRAGDFGGEGTVTQV